MLKRHLRFATAVVLCALACGAAVGDATAGKAPEKKRWEELRDKPIDYAPFERRRAENLKLGTTPVNDAFRLGFATVADMGGQNIVVNDPNLTKGLSAYLRELLPDARGIKAPPIEFVIVDDVGFFSDLRSAAGSSAALDAVLKKEDTTFTAFATPGGAIVLGLSVLKSVKAYDEIDFIIGHEASHILYDHASEDETKEKITTVIAVGVLIGALATQHSNAKTQENVAWTSLGLVVANSLLGPAWSRRQESEADALGYELLMEEGRSAEGANNIMERIQKNEDAVKVYLDFMCGPDTAGERFFKGLIGGILGIPIPEQGYAPYSEVCNQRRNIFASLFRDHPKAVDRKKDLDKHNTQFYADVPPRTVTPIGDGTLSLLQFLSPNGDANRLVHAYDGLVACRSHDMATAHAMARAIPSQGKDETKIPVLELLFCVANADGDPKATQYLEWAMDAPTTDPRMFDMAEAEYVKQGRWADAVKVVDKRVRRHLATPEQTYPTLIRYLRLAGQTARMEEVLTACKALIGPEMTLPCEAMAHPAPPEVASPQAPAAPAITPAPGTTPAAGTAPPKP